MRLSEFDALVKKIYADDKVTAGEILKLQSAVDAKQEEALQAIGAKARRSTVGALIASFEVTVQLLQEAALKWRKARRQGKISQEDFGKVAAMIEANIELLKANLKAFSD